MKRLLVVGASGDVGRGAVSVALAKGWQVVGAARDPAKLEELAAEHGGKLEVVAGNAVDEASAAALVDSAAAKFGGIDAAVVSVNVLGPTQPLVTWKADALMQFIGANLMPHFLLGAAILPRLTSGGVYIGIGGGMADFVPRNSGNISMAQAALRVMYRAMIREARDLPVAVRELMVVSMVNGKRQRAIAEPSWLTDEEIGRHICVIIETPEKFPEPILVLKSREQAGKPDIAD